MRLQVWMVLLLLLCVLQLVAVAGRPVSVSGPRADAQSHSFAVSSHANSTDSSVSSGRFHGDQWLPDSVVTSQRLPRLRLDRQQTRNDRKSTPKKAKQNGRKKVNRGQKRPIGKGGKARLAVDEAQRSAFFQRFNSGIHKLASDFNEQNQMLLSATSNDLLTNELFNYFDLNQDRQIRFDEFKVILQLLGVVALT